MLGTLDEVTLVLVETSSIEVMR